VTYESDEGEELRSEGSMKVCGEEEEVFPPGTNFNI